MSTVKEAIGVFENVLVLLFAGAVPALGIWGIAGWLDKVGGQTNKDLPPGQGRPRHFLN